MLNTVLNVQKVSPKQELYWKNALVDDLIAIIKFHQNKSCIEIGINSSSLIETYSRFTKTRVVLKFSFVVYELY